MLSSLPEAYRGDGKCGQREGIWGNDWSKIMSAVRLSDLHHGGMQDLAGLALRWVLGPDDL